MRLKKFDLINHSIRVIYQDEVILDGEKVWGYCDPYKGLIHVATKSVYDGSALSEDQINHNTHHEVAHYKMYFIDDAFYANERKIDLLGSLTAQYEKSRVME
jgi:hypothetical protein